MKIVHICLCGPYNDGWNYQENTLSYYHKKMGYDVSIITTPFINDRQSTDYLFFETGEYIDKNGIKIIRKPLKFSNKSRISKRFRLYKGLYESLENENPDIIFIHGLQFLDIYKVVKYARNHPDTRIYVDGHEDFENSAKNWLSKNILHGIIWKHCAQIIEPYVLKFWGVLPARVEFLVKMYELPEEKVHLLVMGADDEKVEEAKSKNIRESIRKEMNVNKNDFLIVTGGKIDQNKSQTLLLMKAIKNMNIKNVKLVIFGSVIEEYKEQFSALLCDSIQYIGWINPEDTYKYFNAGELVVFPGLHSVFWEQVVGLGMPCVFKYIEGFTHVDLGGNCKYLYKDSEDEIETVIKEIICNDTTYINMKKVAISKGMDAFSYKKIAKKSIEIPENLRTNSKYG